MPKIRLLDVETNGEAPPDEVLEVGRCDLEMIDNVWIASRPTSDLYASPGLKLRPETRAIHHITPAMIAGRRAFDPRREVDAAIKANVVLFAGHAWDLCEGKWMTEEIIRPLKALCTYKAALRVWPNAPSHSLWGLIYWLEDQGWIEPWNSDPTVDGKLEPHRAGCDALAGAKLLHALLQHQSARVMESWTREPKMLPRCPIGKFRGKPWSQVESGFLEWMVKQQDMEVDLKWLAHRELERRAFVDEPPPRDDPPPPTDEPI